MCVIVNMQKVYSKAQQKGANEKCRKASVWAKHRKLVCFHDPGTGFLQCNETVGKYLNCICTGKFRIDLDVHDNFEMQDLFVVETVQYYRDTCFVWNSWSVCWPWRVKMVCSPDRQQCVKA